MRSFAIVASMCVAAVCGCSKKNGQGTKADYIEADLPDIVTIPASTFGSDVSVTIVAPGEPLSVTCNEGWAGIVGGSADCQQGENLSFKLWAEPNFSKSRRNGEILVTGLVTGVTTPLEITQAPYFKEIKDGFPARFESKTSDNSQWVLKGVCSPAGSTAVLTVVGVNGNELKLNADSGPSVAGLAEGDYLLYAVPVVKAEAGRQFDFMCTIDAQAENSPKYFIFEYWDDGQWKTVEKDLRVAEEDGKTKYSFYNKFFSSVYYTCFTQTFQITKPVENDCIKVRLRVVGNWTGSGTTLSAKGSSGGTFIPAAGQHMGMYLITYENAPKVKDTKKFLFVGNSMTYYYATHFMFKEIARSQGHQVESVVATKGSQTFGNHIVLERSQEAIKRGGYDYAFLQDEDMRSAEYELKGTAEILNSFRTLVGQVRAASPNCHVIYERNWAYSKNEYQGYGSFENYDRLLKAGAEKLVRDLGDPDVEISHIGEGFRVARETKWPEIGNRGLDLLYSDGLHQSRGGAYMKACMNYLLIYGEEYDSNMPDCGLSPTEASMIRKIALQVVPVGKKN